MDDVTTSCNLDHLVWRGPFRPDGVYLSALRDDMPQKQHRIEAGRTATAHCFTITAMQNFSVLHLTANLIAARAQITAHYRTLFIGREFVSQHYCWTADSARWVLCDNL